MSLAAISLLVIEVFGVGMMLWRISIASAAPLFVDEFNGAALDGSLWAVDDGTAGIRVNDGLLALAGQPYHKRLTSIATFTPTKGGVVAHARMSLDGDYQKFGFGIRDVHRRSIPSSGFYFDTFDDQFGENEGFVRAQIWSTPPSGPYVLHFDTRVQVSWGSFHDFGVKWTPQAVVFSIDGAEVARFAYAFTEPLPIGIINDRLTAMLVDSTVVSSAA